MLGRMVRPCSLLFFVCLIVAATASAQTPPAGQPPPPKEPELGWANSTELSVVIATGNAQSTSVGLRNVYTYTWSNALLRWETGWLRADSRDGDRFAVESGSGFDVIDPGTAVDSHRLFSKLRYQRQLTTRTDWFADFDSIRDEPANINRLLVIGGGIGTTWRKTETLTFRTSYGITYTHENLVLEGTNRFAGYRLYYGLKALPVETTTVESELTFDGSFETGDDIRFDWLNSVSVAINTRIALKSSLRVLFRNLPALEELDLKTGDGLVIGIVEVEKQKLDTSFTTSLVFSF
jgi:putative salt-induced outer membrane protein YdiY